MQAADPLALKPIHATVCFLSDLANSIQVDHPEQSGREGLPKCSGLPAFPCSAVVEQQGGVGNTVQNKSYVRTMCKNEGGVSIFAAGTN